MPDNTTSRLDSLGALADQQRLSAPGMMSGQFPDEILDPVIREIEQKFGFVPDHDALRARLGAGLSRPDHRAPRRRRGREAVQQNAQLYVRQHQRAPAGYDVPPSGTASPQSGVRGRSCIKL